MTLCVTSQNAPGRKGSYPAVLRPDFHGRRLNLYFDDVVEGPGAAMPADIEALYSFGLEWLAEVHKLPSSSTVVHCGAGVSRSAAAALMLLVLYFQNYIAAATHLFRLAPHVAPNALICRLISEKFGPVYGRRSQNCCLLFIIFLGWSDCISC